jgi:hypothetical protein
VGGVEEGFEEVRSFVLGFLSALGRGIVIFGIVRLGEESSCTSRSIRFARWSNVALK